MHASSPHLKGPPIGKSVFIATFALNLLALALPLVVLQIFDRVIPFQATETLFFLFLGLCVVAVLEFTLKSARTVLLGNAGKSFERRLCRQFMNATLNADPETFSSRTPAAHLDQFAAISQLRGFYAGQGRILAIDLPFTVLFVAMIGLIGGWLVLVPLGCIASLLLFKTMLQAAQSSIFEKRRVLDSRRHSFLAEALSQIRTLKANTMEPQISRRYELLQAQTTDISHRIIKFSGRSQSFGALFGQAAVATMGLFGSYLIIVGQIGIAELAACMLLNGRTVQPMLKALGVWVQSESISAAKAKFEEACAVKSRPDSVKRHSELVGGVCFDCVAMKHPEKDDFLFRNVQMEIPVGECLFVTGHGGAGKSTFLKLILGELAPSKGKVLIDGKPASYFLTTRGHGGIGYIDQKPVVFAGTVMENISAFGDGDTIERALDLSVRLGIEKYIHRLPLGYNTQVLSSPTLMNNRSAIQGIALVRALALQPKILLSNNIGAAMDNKTKLAFEKYIVHHSGEMTIVLAEVSDCFKGIADRVLHLQEGNDMLVAQWDADVQADITEGDAQLRPNTAAVA